MAKNPSKVVMVRKDRNVVADNACWEEAIKKETKSQVLNEHFQLNPKSCEPSVLPQWSSLPISR